MLHRLRLAREGFPLSKFNRATSADKTVFRSAVIAKGSVAAESQHNSLARHPHRPLQHGPASAADASNPHPPESPARRHQAVAPVGQSRSSAAPLRPQAQQLPPVTTTLTQNHQGHQSGRSRHPLYLLEPLSRPITASTDRRRWSRQSLEQSKPPSSRYCDGHPDNRRYSRIASTVIVQKTGGHLLVWRVVVTVAVVLTLVVVVTVALEWDCRFRWTLHLFCWPMPIK